MPVVAIVAIVTISVVSGLSILARIYYKTRTYRRMRRSDLTEPLTTQSTTSIAPNTPFIRPSFTSRLRRNLSRPNAPTLDRDDFDYENHPDRKTVIDT